MPRGTTSEDMDANALLDTYVIAQDAQVNLWRQASNRKITRPAQGHSGRTDWRDMYALALAGEAESEVRNVLDADLKGPPQFRYRSARVKTYLLLSDQEGAVTAAHQISHSPRDGRYAKFKVHDLLIACDREGAAQFARSITDPAYRAKALGEILGLHKEAAAVCMQLPPFEDAPPCTKILYAEAYIAGKEFAKAEAIADSLDSPERKAKIYAATGSREKAREQIAQMGQGTQQEDLRHLVQETCDAADSEVAFVVGCELAVAMNRGENVRVAWPLLQAKLCIKNGDFPQTIAAAQHINEPFRRSRILREAGDRAGALKAAREEQDPYLRSHVLAEIGHYAEASAAARLLQRKGEQQLALNAWVRILEQMKVPEIAAQLLSLPRDQKKRLIQQRAHNNHTDHLIALGRTVEREVVAETLSSLRGGTHARILGALGVQIAAAPDVEHILRVHQDPLRKAISP